MNKVNFKSRKEATEFLKEKGIDTSNWTEEKWQSINKSQAEIHIQAIAELMWDAYNESTPKELQPGEWHIPFGDNFKGGELRKLVSEEEYTNFTKEDLELLKVKIATARCARISYETLGDDPKIDYEADIKLHDILLKSGHASPMEHIAQCVDNSNWYGNFKGWNQYRKILESQNLL